MSRCQVQLECYVKMEIMHAHDKKNITNDLSIFMQKKKRELFSVKKTCSSY